MAGGLGQGDWNNLLSAIKTGRCTPFLGAGASSASLPLGSQLAREWAIEYGYPLPDSEDLIRVSQYLLVENGRFFPKEQLIDRFRRNSNAPDFDNPDEPHRVLADLPLPVYMTTNYDHFLKQALTRIGKKPQQRFCRWNELVKTEALMGGETEHIPTRQEPLVFHLHGHVDEIDSLVLTEDDYLDFLVNISRDDELLPRPVRKMLVQGSVLFLGYKLADWNFQVLFRSFVRYLERSSHSRHISVQLDPLSEGTPEDQRARARQYLGKYFDSQNIAVYWGDCREFARELRQRWTDYGKTSEALAVGQSQV
jgi:hypothetical protein